MKRVRIIPRLDIKGANLVKGIHLEGLRVLGLPERFSINYFQEGADELIYIDSVASLYGRNSLDDVVRRTAENVFTPITVGGGLRTIDDIRRILRSGADKVAINTAAVNNPQLITEAAKVFGAQCIVVSIQAMKKGEGKYEVYTDNAREPTGKDVFKWAREVVDRGAGEILITSIDQEGTGEGFDTKLVAGIVDSVDVPVIACGGAGKIEHFEEIINSCDVSAVSAASIFHYDIINRFGVESRDGGNVEYLKSTVGGGKSFQRVESISVSALKKALTETGILCIDNNLPSDFSERVEHLRNKVVASSGRPPKVVMVDYGRSNLFSIEQALTNLGADVEITDNPEKIIAAERLVIAGVGAFADGMQGLRDHNLVEPIQEYARMGRPVLGICLGMQLLMDQSEEFGLTSGLGLIKGKVVSLQKNENSTERLRIPHIGWNQIQFPEDDGSGERWSQHFLLDDVLPNEFVYFVHSFVVVSEDKSAVIAETTYGSNKFCAVVVKNNVIGCQFHPERSGLVGLTMYYNFLLNR